MRISGVTSTLHDEDCSGPGNEKVPHLVLVGQPNCGKSTIFNSLAGFKANTGNFAGTSVEYTESLVMVGGRRILLTDLPGTYSLSPSDDAEKVTRNWLDERRADAVILVLDASVLSRSLELCLEMAETDIPFVVILNMMDEAARKGIQIDADRLARLLGVPVIPAVARRGQGVVRAFIHALAAAGRGPTVIRPAYDRDVDEAIAGIERLMPGDMKSGSTRFCAVRILEGDELVEQELGRRDVAALQSALAVRKRLAADHGWPESGVFSSHRHAIAVNLFESVSKVASRTRKSGGEQLDAVVMHPFAGPLLATAVLAGFFGLSFFAGSLISGLVSSPFEALGTGIVQMVPGIAGTVIKGIADGLGGGLGIVLPYLLPLLFFLSLLEDVGYLPRAAFLMDGVMHRIGLHGKSAIPLIMGFGCNVPSILGARVLESRRDRILTVMIAPFIACSARTVVILALVGAVFGPWWVIVVYFLNILVAAGVGKALSSFVPGVPVGLLMDIPPYRVPPIRSVMAKVWFRVREFLVSAWPTLIVASVVMALLETWGIGDATNRFLAPFTSGVLGLPAATGITLVFGIFRKELTLIMLFTALGTTDVLSVMTPVQVMTFVVFVLFYVPCVATIVTQVRETGWKWTGLSVVLNVIVATVAAVAVRLVGGLLMV